MDANEVLAKLLACEPDTLEAGRKAIEDTLIEFRNSRISMLNAGNGFVVREKDATPSSAIRLSTAAGLRIGLLAILASLGVEAK